MKIELRNTILCAFPHKSEAETSLIFHLFSFLVLPCYIFLSLSMRPFSEGKKKKKIISISHSKSNSSSTCSSPSSLHNQMTNVSPSSSSARKSMEEVWKDINLPNLHNQSNSTITNSTTNYSNFPGMILQNFLARPFDKHLSIEHSSAATIDDNNSNDFLNLLEPSPPTLLSFHSGSSDFQFLIKSNPNTQLNSHVSVGSCFHALSSSISHSICQKRAPENEENSSDWKHKKMIKNRESAARSRARKQAYTQELKLEIAYLRKENGKLRRQQEKFMEVAGNLPKKNTLNRTLTAPF